MVSIKYPRLIAARTHFNPEGKPAPPRPRRPDALISEMICSQSAQLTESFASTHPVVALEYNLLCLVPVSVFHGALQVRAMVAVEVLEYAVLVLQAPICALRRIIHGCERSPLGLRRGGGGGGSRKACSRRCCGKSPMSDGAQRLRSRSMAGEHLERGIELCSCN